MEIDLSSFRLLRVVNSGWAWTIIIIIAMAL